MSQSTLALALGMHQPQVRRLEARPDEPLPRNVQLPMWAIKTMYG